MRLLSAVEDKITTSTSYGLKSWQNGYATVQKETVEALAGTLPKDIEGTFFRNGFGKFEIGKTYDLPGNYFWSVTGQLWM